MIEKYTLRYLPLFYSDLEDILDYIAYTLENKNAAIVLLRAVEEAIRERSCTPTAYQAYNSVKKRLLPYYRIYAGSFIIFYVVYQDERVMEIRRILYGRRNLAAFL